MDKRPPAGKRKSGFYALTEYFSTHLAQHHLVPLLLLPAVISGFSLFTIAGLPIAFRSASSTDRIIGLIFPLIGVGGTAATFYFARAIKNKPAGWRLFNLGRTAWLVLIRVAWLAGLGGGILMLSEVSR